MNTMLSYVPRMKKRKPSLTESQGIAFQYFTKIIGCIICTCKVLTADALRGSNLNQMQLQLKTQMNSQWPVVMYRKEIVNFPMFNAFTSFISDYFALYTDNGVNKIRTKMHIESKRAAPHKPLAV